MLFHPFKKLNPKFYIIEFITNNFCSNMNNETLYKITNFQHNKLSKLQIREIANHITHDNYYLMFIGLYLRQLFPQKILEYS